MTEEPNLRAVDRGSAIRLLIYGLLIVAVGFTVLSATSADGDSVIYFVSLLLRVLGIVLLIFGVGGLWKTRRGYLSRQGKPDSSDDE